MNDDNGLSERASTLKARREEILKKITKLERDSIIYAAGGVKFQIEEELKQANEDLTRTDRSLRDNDADRMYYALATMDYLDQNLSFDNYIRSQRIAAFLIHGASGDGQSWLLWRLVESIRGEHPEVEIEQIEFNLGSLNSRKNVDELWYQLAQRVQIPRRPPPTNDQIAREATAWLETKTVILIMLAIDTWAQQDAHALIDEFWSGLVKAAQDSLDASMPTKLIMFLVDYKDEVCRWNVPLIDAPAQQVEPSIPIRLQKVTPFTVELVKPWAQNRYFGFKDLLSPLMINLDQTIGTIIQDSQGIPDDVARHICECCQQYYQPERWLKL